ncbi:MAG: metallophosphoesterase, partial [Actinomycetota bacterium]|nr:metallophosphoesterase [Actinomycetota bacterium]
MAGLGISLLLLSAMGSAPPARGVGQDCVVTVAGDIGGGASGSSAFLDATSTGDLVRSVAPTYALTAGDNAYPDGTATDYQQKYDPTWGSFTSITRPVPGNHEYNLVDAPGYYGYFFNGVRDGNEYYATDCGTWRLYALNCEIACGDGSAQLAWLQADLAAHPGGHYLGYLHRPRFTSGTSHPSSTAVSPLYRALQAAGGDVIIGGHNHQYERFGKQDADGIANSMGLRQFVVGTGGNGITGFGAPVANSEVRNAEQFGVLKLTLSPATYSWQFLSSGRRSTGTSSFDDPAHPAGTVLDTGTTATNTSTGGNRAPVVDAGKDQSVVLPAAAPLSGSVSDDGLPNPPGSTTSSWSKLSGPGDVTFADATSPSTTAAFSQVGTYLLRLSASDGELTVGDDVVVEALPAGTPATVEARVAVSSDDAEEKASGAVSLTSTDLELVTDGTAVQTVGVRFPGVNVPVGASISRAYVQFQVDEVSTDAAALTVRGVAADSTVTFTTTTRDVSSRPLTSASVAWSPASWPTVGARGVEQQTPDLSQLVQEIVNRPGWTSGNAVGVVVTGTGRRTAEAVDGTFAPLLHLEYRTGGTPVNRAPLVEAGPAQQVVQPAAANLSGSVSDDGLPNPPAAVTSTWSVVSGPGSVVFGDSTRPSTTASFSQPGSYLLRLTAYDGELTTTDDVAVEALPANTPVVLEVRVAVGSDDAEEKVSGKTLGKVSLTSGDLELVVDTQVQQLVGIRFAGLSI